MEPRMKLVVRGRAAEYALDSDVVLLGREQTRAVPIDDPLVSRQHAELICVGGADYRQIWQIRDLGSTNGTYVNDALLTEPRRLSTGDQVRVGGTVLVYEEIDSGQGFRNFVAVLIALATLVGAVVAWRASVAADHAAGSRASGTTVLISLTQNETEVAATLFQNLDAFTAYAWHLALANLIDADRREVQDNALQNQLEDDRLRHANLALAALDLVNLDYLHRASEPSASGKATFDRDRFFETNMAEVASQVDLDYQAHFDASDRAATTTERLTAVAVMLSLAVFFYTGAALARSRLKYLWVGIGAVMFGLGGLAAAVIEFSSLIG